MQHLKVYLTFFLVMRLFSGFAQQTIEVHPFNKVIISPFIQVTFVEGSEEKVTIENSTVDNQLLHIEVNGNTLRLYLEGAKEVPNVDIKVNKKGDLDNYHNYRGTVVTATITYKKLVDVSVRGEELLIFKSPLTGKTFRLKVYGTAEVNMNEVDLDECHATIYGESTLNIKSGRIGYQRYTVYGSSSINSLAINSNSSKLTSYGEAKFYVNVSDIIKINAFGEALLQYKGDAIVSRGIQIGEMTIDRMN